MLIKGPWVTVCFANSFYSHAGKCCKCYIWNYLAYHRAIDNHMHTYIFIESSNGFTEVYVRDHHMIQHFDNIALKFHQLTQWGRVTHICVSKLTIIGSDNGLSPGRRQAIIWTNAWILSIWTWGTNFSEILSEIHAFSFEKMHLKMPSAKWRPIWSRP